jgi:post-segregation antitoxin (ccd killing protein)
VDGGGAAQASGEQKLIAGGGDAIWMAWDQELIARGRAAPLNTSGATTRGIQLAAMNLAGGRED